MTRLVRIAARELGPLPAGRCYRLKAAAVIGGSYDADNMGTITTDELISFAGDMAKQIKDVPAGGEISTEIVRNPLPATSE